MQETLDNRVIVRVAGEPRDVVEDHELHVAFVQAAELQNLEKVWPVCGFGGLSSVGELVGIGRISTDNQFLSLSLFGAPRSLLLACPSAGACSRRVRPWRLDEPV